MLPMPEKRPVALPPSLPLPPAASSPSVQRVMQGNVRRDTTPERALRYHRDVFRAVERGNRVQAREAMNRHMDEAIATMTAALAGLPPSR